MFDLEFLHSGYRRNVFIFFLLIFLELLISSPFTHSSALSLELQNLIEAYKQDPRGPYQAIRWFCPDGSLAIPPKRCSQPGGIQHALAKDRVQKLASDNHIFLGQILAGTSKTEFWDEDNQNSRLKQYQMERFLQRIDDGWIMRKARYYRGAIQAEDEEEWGLKFFRELLSRNDNVEVYFFLIRQAAKDISHGGAKDKYWDNIRAYAQNIADKLPAFANLRIKLHGQPDENDLQSVKEFRLANKAILTPELENMFDKLIEDLETVYQRVNLHMLDRYLPLIPKDSPITEPLKKLIKTDIKNSEMVSERITDLMWSCRTNILSNPKGSNRLTLLDLSIQLETLLFIEMTGWNPETVGELLAKNYFLAKASAACGYLEIWEWEMIESILHPPDIREELEFKKFAEKVDFARRTVEWGTGMFRAEYRETLELFGKFEPLAAGFLDDRIRVSLLLHLGETAAQLAELVATISGVSNRVLNLKNQNSIRGLNPGLAVGELELIGGSPEDIEFSEKKIYVMANPPTDLKPVAGIITVSEGNLVSHLQLLARNLGIPNSIISLQNFHELKNFNNQEVLYAVSPRGAVIMMPAADMPRQIQTLVEEAKRPDQKIAVPVERIDLKADITGLNNLRAFDSGRICGPKAANLGQLKYMFPEHVVDGLIIPFSIFRQHFDQQISGTNVTYWQFLQKIFQEANQAREQGEQDEIVEKTIVQKLAEFRRMIQDMPFLPDFELKLAAKYKEILGASMGELAAFIRSDTNMEDLKDFTGAGLNLTVFNVREPLKIMQAIKDVWASPFTERSYRWRQKYLLNPSHVYPSILILPTINVEKSGVMITTGISSSNEKDITIAFSKGPGGAVEGQAAESYLLRNDGLNLLLSPSREMKYTYLPETGGKLIQFARFHDQLLSGDELNQLRQMAGQINNKFSTMNGLGIPGPYDVELGFKDHKLWLFQVRPYVENKKIRSSLYLQSLDPEISQSLTIRMDKEL